MTVVKMEAVSSSSPTPAVETEYPTGWKAPSVPQDMVEGGEASNDQGPTAKPTVMFVPKAVDITQSVESPRVSADGQIPIALYGFIFFVGAFIVYLGWRKLSRTSSSTSSSSSSSSSFSVGLTNINRGGYERVSTTQK